MPETQPTLKTRLAHPLFGDIIQLAVAEAAAAVSVRVDDTAGWNRLARAGPHGRDLSTLLTAPAARAWLPFR